MLINNMNHRIKVFALILEENDFMGLDEKGERLVAEVWGEVIRPRYRDLISAGANTGIIDLEVNIRKNNQIERGMIVELNGSRYDIIHVDNFSKEMTKLLIQTKEVGM